MCSQKRTLTGVKPTGAPHIGNYLGAIRPAIELSREHDSFLFIADLHALTTNHDPEALTEQTYAIAATWLACGVDPKKTVFYRQSDVPETTYLAWILSCFTPVGLLARAHSFKEVSDKVDERESGDLAAKEAASKAKDVLRGILLEQLKTSVDKHRTVYEALLKSTETSFEAQFQTQTKHLFGGTRTSRIWQSAHEIDALERVNHGVFYYPILMAADILLYDADLVPVGKDQKQHLEITQEVARKFNHTYGEILRIPEPLIDARVMTVPGLDGRKMSKSYGNTIALFSSDKELKKTIATLQTDSTPYGAPLDPNGETIFTLFSLFSTPEEIAALERQYRTGRQTSAGGDGEDNYFGWGHAKRALMECILDKLDGPRTEYTRLIKDKAYLEELLAEGATRARNVAQGVLRRVQQAVGLPANGLF